MFLAMLQFTRLMERLAPTPMMADVLQWPVDTGMPVRLANSSVNTVEKLAATPWYFSSFTMSMPTDLMMRLPPTTVPAEIASEHVIMTHMGKPPASGVELPKESAMPSMAMDMNFWPSCAPCRNDSATAHRSWMAVNTMLAA